MLYFSDFFLSVLAKDCLDLKHCINCKVEKIDIQSCSRVSLQILEGKKAHFYIFDSIDSVFENLKKPLFYKS